MDCPRLRLAGRPRDVNRLLHTTERSVIQSTLLASYPAKPQNSTDDLLKGYFAITEKMGYEHLFPAFFGRSGTG